MQKRYKRNFVIKKTIIRILILALSILVFPFYSCTVHKYHPPHSKSHIKKPLYGPHKKIKLGELNLRPNSTGT